MSVSNSKDWRNSDHLYSDSSATMSWVIFKPDETDIETFVEEKAPSKVLREDGYTWIYVGSKTRPQTKELDERLENEYDVNQDTVEMFDEENNLMRDWEALCKSGKSSVTYQAVCRLAKANGIKKGGKWLVHEPSAAKVDKVWADIARATWKGNLGSAAKVSPRDGRKSKVICVYNEDFTDRDSVLNLEKGLRHLGIGIDLVYKPDIYTYLGVYAKNKWNIKATICSSKYDYAKEKWNVQFTNDAAGTMTQTKLTQFMKRVPRPSTSHESDVEHTSSPKQEPPRDQSHTSKRIASDKETDSTNTKVPKV